jgi:hypothetical protein
MDIENTIFNYNLLWLFQNPLQALEIKIGK